MISVALWLPLAGIYLAASLALLVYGLNCYVLVVLAWRSRRSSAARAQLAPGDADRWPRVTTQIAIYNELNVAERAVRAACAMEYPRDRHEVQVLDDSTDETAWLLERLAQELGAKGHRVRLLRREHRVGFKAGALEEGLRQADGELVAVFDADFVPPRDFLLRTVPLFRADPALALVQTRWGHLNRHASWLTRVQALGIDGHFLIEQPARCGNGLFMNFNGTAGMWRRQAVESCGGWQGDTLTEDLDLSYRVQFAGWRTAYLPDVVAPGELPESMGALRQQQFRWAKGSFQTLLKHFGALARGPGSLFKKLQAVLHMGGYAVHPLMFTLSVLAWPMMALAPWPLAAHDWLGWLIVPLVASVLGPSFLYLMGQVSGGGRWLSAFAWMPALVVVGIGLAFSNSRAVMEAAVGRSTEFVRTPKRGERELKTYPVSIPGMALVELLLGLYLICSTMAYVKAGRAGDAAFLVLYAAGYLTVGLLSWAPAQRRPSTARAALPAQRPDPA